MTVSRRGGPGHAGDPSGRKDDGADDPAGASEPPPRHRTLGLRDGLPGLRDLMDRLLAADGCPWDRAQTLDTLRPYLLEEAHEVLDAMGDPPRHVGELGDLLFQIVFQSALRERERAFDLDDVVAAIREKMIDRHPHVFGPDREALDAAEVTRRWEARKQGERAAQGEASLGVPRGLPALHRAARLQDKAAALGFDWPDVDGALAKLDEELDELERARRSESAAAVMDELGDVLFVLVRVAGKLGIDAEAALGHANAKFERRFAHVLRTAAARGQAPASLGLAGLDVLWDEAKRLEAARELAPLE
ncbi:MAG TPA: nucleoside triphosphate pyrophosphohydrolase [Nannocystaceae bacterium]|nr:nucleoside triphosphate pyrophosphohydrolase [Nannocystaceae bacterium]